MATLRVIQDKEAGTLTLQWGDPASIRATQQVNEVSGGLAVDLDEKRGPVGIEVIRFRPENPDEDIKVELKVIQKSI